TGDEPHGRAFLCSCFRFEYEELGFLVEAIGALIRALNGELAFGTDAHTVARQERFARFGVLGKVRPSAGARDSDVTFDDLDGVIRDECGRPSGLCAQMQRRKSE